jgi:hypothetical protein
MPHINTSAIGAIDLLQDASRAPGPDERLGFDILMSDVVIDRGNQFRHAGEHTAARPLGDQIANKRSTVFSQDAHSHASPATREIGLMLTCMEGDV